MHSDSPHIQRRATATCTNSKDCNLANLLTREFVSRSCTTSISSVLLWGRIYGRELTKIPPILTDIVSVCFASMYRIITITRLVRTTDISWAKSDVFIWSSVEPSIGIISGCLPTLRPLMLHLLQSWFNFIPSERSSSGKGSRSISLNPIETIGKKRTRKISRQDTLGGSQFTELNDADIDEERRGQHSRAWRPDEDDMCLTTTTVHAHSDSRSGTERSTPEARDGGGINVTKEFEWDEATTHPVKI